VRALSFLIALLEVMETCPALRIRPFAGLLTPVPTPRRRVARHSIIVTARPQPARDRAGGDRSREGRGSAPISGTDSPTSLARNTFTCSQTKKRAGAARSSSVHMARAP